MVSLLLCTRFHEDTLKFFNQFLKVMLSTRVSTFVGVTLHIFFDKIIEKLTEKGSGRVESSRPLKREPP